MTILATLTTIIGFLVTGTTQDAEDSVGENYSLLTGQSKQIWSLVVGILGAISTLFSAIGKHTNYQSQGDMHRSAVNALEKIYLSLEFERVSYDRNVRELKYSDEHKKEDLKSRLVATLKIHQASLKGVLDACCDSPVPCEVAQAFSLAEQIFCLQSYEEDGFDLRPLMYHYNKLWKEYTTYQLGGKYFCRCWLWRFRWPFMVPILKVPEKFENGRMKGESCRMFFLRKKFDTISILGL